MDPKLRVMVVDDEQPARQRVLDLLQRHGDVDVVGQCTNGVEASSAIGSSTPDMIFLDVQMPQLDGFGVIDRVGVEHMPVTIFVTAYDRYALDAFEANAIDYLLKPFSDERFEAALHRARRHVRSREKDVLSEKLFGLLEQYRSSPQKVPFLDRIAIKTAGKVTFLPVDEISWIEGAGVYVRIHAREHRHLLRDTVGGIASKLDPQQFIRIHRSTIVPLDRIKEMESDGKGAFHVVLSDGTRLKLSRGYRDQLEQRLGQRL